MGNDWLFSVVVPYRNEERILPESQVVISQLVRARIQVIMVDSRSLDNSNRIVREWDLPLCNISCSADPPSIGQAVMSALPFCGPPYVCILPIDVKVTLVHFEDLQYFLKTRPHVSWGGFFKTFDRREWYFSLYALIQNRFRFQLFHKGVWTNVLFVRKSLLASVLFKPQGFMEDTQLSDGLRTSFFGIPSARPAIVSSRKYRGKGIRQILINILILIRYRLKMGSLEDLRKLYNL